MEKKKKKKSTKKVGSMWDLGGGRNSTRHLTYQFCSVFFIFLFFFYFFFIFFIYIFLLFLRIELKFHTDCRYDVSNLIRGCGDLATCLRVATPLVSLMEIMIEEVNRKALKTR